MTSVLSNVLDCAKEGLRLHHHTGPASIRLVVHTAVSVCGEVSQVVNHHVQGPTTCRASDNTFRQERANHRRKDRDHVELHVAVSNLPPPIQLQQSVWGLHHDELPLDIDTYADRIHQGNLY